MNAVVATYFVATLLLADGLGNIETTGHNWGLEVFVSTTALFVAGMTHLILKNR